MMEDNKMHPADCPCPCHHYMRGRYFLLRWVLGLLILVIVFAIGVKVGEFKGVLDNSGYGAEFGRHMMGGWGGYNFYYGNPPGDYYAPPMMRFLPATTTPSKTK